jgi:hypothetical protein
MTATTDTGVENPDQDKDLEGQPVQPDPNAPSTSEPAAPKPGVAEPHDNGYPHTQLKEPPAN